MRQSNLNTTAPSINDPINIRTKELKTPLHLAAQSGRETAVEALLSLGADVNSRSGNRSSPLHLAAVSGHIWVLRYIITRKGRINARDDEQMTPLHRYVCYSMINSCYLDLISVWNELLFLVHLSVKNSTSIATWAMLRTLRVLGKAHGTVCGILTSLQGLPFFFLILTRNHLNKKKDPEEEIV